MYRESFSSGSAPREHMCLVGKAMCAVSSTLVGMGACFVAEYTDVFRGSQSEDSTTLNTTAEILPRPFEAFKDGESLIDVPIIFHIAHRRGERVVTLHMETTHDRYVLNINGVRYRSTDCTLDGKPVLGPQIIKAVLKRPNGISIDCSLGTGSIRSEDLIVLLAEHSGRNPPHPKHIETIVPVTIEIGVGLSIQKLFPINLTRVEEKIQLPDPMIAQAE